MDSNPDFVTFRLYVLEKVSWLLGAFPCVSLSVKWILFRTNFLDRVMSP